ncbi:MAG TPA: hypothetical protein VEO74_14430 [Thermoanaerobaculia bacterium]|nr:hypothetical protein [Thermoanaerobaculia bacterium]
MATNKNEKGETNGGGAASLTSEQRLARVLDFLEKESWPSVPRKLLSRRLSKKERERILG